MKKFKALKNTMNIGATMAVTEDKKGDLFPEIQTSVNWNFENVSLDYEQSKDLLARAINAQLENFAKLYFQEIGDDDENKDYKELAVIIDIIRDAEAIAIDNIVDKGLENG